MTNAFKQSFLTLCFLPLIMHTSNAFSQQKVVVIPMQGDSATPNLTFVAFGIIERKSTPEFTLLSLPKGVNASISNSAFGYTLTLSGYQGTLNPVIFLTPAPGVSGDDDFCNLNSTATSSTPGSYTAQIQCFPGRPSFLQWMIMG